MSFGIRISATGMCVSRGLQNVPFRDAAIGGKPAVQMTAGSSVLIQHVSPDDRSKALDVKERVLQFERIERPLNESDAAAHRFLALPEFEHSADTVVLICREHAHHVAVQIRPAAGLDSGNRKEKADHAGAVVCPEDLAADFGRYDEQADGQQFEFAEAPDLFLQPHGFGKICMISEVADFDSPVHRPAGCSS